MAFMVPVVKKDYDIYSKSPPKNKPIVKSSQNQSQNGSNNNSANKLIGGRQQSNSITIGLLQHKQQRQRNPQRIHSKSVNETITPLNERHRSTSNSSTNDSSSESLEIIRKMMHFLSSSANNKNSNTTENQKQSKKTSNETNHKTHWTSKIFRKRKNSLNSHKIS